YIMWGKRNGNNGTYDNEDKSYKRLKATAIVLAILAVVLGVSFAIGLTLGGSSSSKNVAVSKENESSIESSPKETSSQLQQVSSSEVEVDNGYNIDDLYYEVQLRANTIIIAENEEIWEEIEIDKGFLIETVPLLKGKDDYLYKELLKWDDLDFSNAVEVHNYVWEKLGGTVGKAIAINEDAVQALKERLSQ
ncbi:DUF6241 domain-containing protein, partial [Clostridium sp.]|uniref:DUF6241 domain-containing protein n=1 Tax=Clostridium sp. TaxID=1506 RepID=UPI003BAEA706